MYEEEFPRRSKEFEAVIAAIGKVQRKVKNIGNTQVNTYHKNRYSPLDEVFEAVKPVLEENDLVFTQTDEPHSGKMFLNTTIYLGSQWISSYAELYCGDKPTCQALGSAMTYMKRYLLLAALGIATTNEDCDGEVNRKEIEGKNKIEAAKKPTMEGKVPTLASPERVAALEKALKGKEEIRNKALKFYRVPSLGLLSEEQASVLLQRAIKE